MSGAEILAGMVLAFYVGLVLPLLVGRVRRWWLLRNFTESVRIVELPPTPHWTRDPSPRRRRAS